MTEAEAWQMIRAAAEEITGDDGNAVGRVVAPVRIRLRRRELANGGFLVIEWDDETATYRATEYDALWDKRRQKYYPAGHAFMAWTALADAEAVVKLLDYFAEHGPPLPDDGPPPAMF